MEEPFQLRIAYNPDTFQFTIDDINDPGPVINFNLGSTDEQVFSRVTVTGEVQIPFIGFAKIGESAAQALMR